MILTITGKPCSGKGSIGKLFAEKYNYKYMCVGDMMRSLAEQNGYSSVLEMQKNDEMQKQIDIKVEEYQKNLGITHANDNLIIDARLAWMCIPNSFKVFVDVDPDIAAQRLFDAKRENEQVTSVKHAKQILTERWNTENKRFKELYGKNNTNLKEYDLVISSNNRTVESLVDEIYSKLQEKSAK